MCAPLIHRMAVFFAVVTILLPLCAGELSPPGRSLLYESKVSGGSSDPVYLGYDNTNDYSTNRQSAAAFPGMLMMYIFGFFMVIWGLTFCIGRSASCRDNACCQHPCVAGTFCTGPPNPQGYSKRTRIIIVAMMITCNLLLVVCAVLYSAGDKDLHDGTNSIMDNLYSECLTMKTETDRLIATMSCLDENPSTNSMTNATARVCHAISVTKGDISDNNSLAEIISLVCWIILCLTPVLGIISWLTKNGRWSIALIVASWILMCGCWFLFAMAYYQGAWVDDTCVQLQNWYDCKSPSMAYDIKKGMEMPAKCYTQGYLDARNMNNDPQLTLATSGALSNNEDLCPTFLTNASGTPTDYWAHAYASNWMKLKNAVETYNQLFDANGEGGPAFGVSFVPPGSTEAPMRCCIPSDPSSCSSLSDQASCVWQNQSTAYPNVTALRKLYYDAEGGHYDSLVKKCSTLYNTSTATRGTTNEHSFSDFDVKPPTDYDASCMNGYCDINCSTGLFSQGLTKTVMGITVSTIGQRCHEKAILTCADAMWQASYLSSCSYLTDAAEECVADSGPCDTAGDGFIYVFSTTAFAAVVYLILILLGYLGMHAFEAHNYKEEIARLAQKMGQDEEGTQKVHLEVNQLANQLEEKKDYEDVTDDVESKDFADVS